MPVYLLFLGFAALNVLIFAYSRISTSIYVDRYLLPFAILAILLYCELFTQLREADAPAPRLRALSPVIGLVAAAAFFFKPSLQRPWLPLPDYTNDLLAALPPNLPVVDSDGGSFFEVEFYHHKSFPEPILFPMDWKIALIPAKTGGVPCYHEMHNLKAAGIYAGDILPSAQILDRYRDFAVITRLGSEQWLDRRILADPRFSATLYRNFDTAEEHFQIWTVHRN
jgi:hypothetical protein